MGLPQRLAQGQERRRVEDPQLGCQPHRTLHDPLHRGPTQDGAAASWVEVADVTFKATRQSSHVIGFQGRSEMIVTIKQISKNVPYGEDLGKIIITLDDGIRPAERARS